MILENLKTKQQIKKLKSANDSSEETRLGPPH